MRRTDRQVTDFEKMLAIVAGCDCCRLALADEPAPYVVPLNFGFEAEDGRLTLYFHGAGEGKKLALLRARPYAAFEMDKKHQLVTGETACDYSFLYQSVIGRGGVELLRDEADKRRGLSAVMRHYAPEGKDGWAFDGAMLARTTVLRLRVDEWTCKEHG